MADTLVFPASAKEPAVCAKTRVEAAARPIIKAPAEIIAARSRSNTVKYSNQQSSKL